MKRLLLLFTLLLIIAPHISEAAFSRVYEKWMFRDDSDIEAWSYAALEEGRLTSEGLTFDVTEQGALYRELPEGFHKNVDAIKLHYNATGIDEVVVLFITLDSEGGIARRFRLVFPPSFGYTEQYAPLGPHKDEIKGSQVLAIDFKGTAKNVSIDGVRFIHYTPFEKLVATWNSFWTFAPFTGHSINILLGPVITGDPGLIGLFQSWQLEATSVNAYLLVGLSLLGIALLFFAAWQTRIYGKDWNSMRQKILLFFFTAVFGVWVLYDFRMGWAFIQAVADDHVQYISRDASERTFRDRGRFYDFAAFTKHFVKDRKAYELFVPDRWPYFGSMRYETYPSLPNPGDPVSDTWVIYDRIDITMNEEGALELFGAPFTRTGEIIGLFDKYSFIFREFPPEA